VSVISRALGKSGEEAEIDVTSRFDTLALSLLALAEHRCCMNIWEIFILPALARIESRLEGGGGGAESNGRKLIDAVIINYQCNGK